MISIIIPVYNEEKTIAGLLKRVLALPVQKQVIVINDCSTDGTTQILKDINHNAVKVINHTKNLGKGVAIRTGLEYAQGDITAIQDADLELNPEDLIRLIRLLEDKKARAVLGVRIGYKKISLRHLFLSLIINSALEMLQVELFLFYGCMIGDLMSCYKVMPTRLFRELNLRSNGFEIEAEIISKLLKRGLRPLELPVQYIPRLYREGKKIKWHDTLRIALAIIKYKFAD